MPVARIAVRGFAVRGFAVRYALFECGSRSRQSARFFGCEVDVRKNQDSPADAVADRRRATDISLFLELLELNISQPLTL